MIDLAIMEDMFTAYLTKEQSGKRCWSASEGLGHNPVIMNYRLSIQNYEINQFYKKREGNQNY